MLGKDAMLKLRRRKTCFMAFPRLVWFYSFITNAVSEEHTNDATNVYSLECNWEASSPPNSLTLANWGRGAL